MNDPANLGFYTQLIRFQISPTREETLFSSPDPSQQRTIQSWAHALEFEFEYSLALRTARVVRTSFPPETVSDVVDQEFFEFYPTAQAPLVPTRFLEALGREEVPELNYFDALLPILTSSGELAAQPTGLDLQPGEKLYEASDNGTQTDIYSTNYPVYLPPPSTLYPPLAFSSPQVSNHLHRCIHRQCRIYRQHNHIQYCFLHIRSEKLS
jgi:hypothetical protein